MLAIQQLAYRYAGAAESALDDVSLQATRGEVLGLLGPNGAGKTTLMSHLAGLLEVQHGTITIDGEPLATVRARTPTRIAIAPQDYAFYPMLSVQQNLDCFASAARIERTKRVERISLCIATAQLEAFLNTRAEQLSGGLKRRLNLAIALLPEPELILFDEPTVGVDPQTRAFVLDAIRTLDPPGPAPHMVRLRLDKLHRPAEVLAALDATGAQLQHVEFGRYDLEQLFMALTRRPLRD